MADSATATDRACSGPASSADAWPAMPRLADWRETKETLHLWLQIVGKVRLALAPMQNHWWQVPLYVTAQGLTTSAMPYAGGAVEARFDFLEQALAIATSAGGERRVPLEPGSVADFYSTVMAAFEALGVKVRVWPRPVEIPGEPIPFPKDKAPRAYDAAAAERFWRVLVSADRVLNLFRGRFVGKCSPAHVWWGGLDIACTRFSGRRAPRHPGGTPNCADYVAWEGYSHACVSAGWWPGGGGLEEPAFYAYAYPEPARLADARIAPAQAYYHREMREFILPYEAVRTAADPDGALIAFLQSTYAAAADLAGWDRSALERAPDYDPRRPPQGV